MISIETVKEFFGWCAVINIGVLLIATILIVRPQFYFKNSFQVV